MDANAVYRNFAAAVNRQSLFSGSAGEGHGMVTGFYHVLRYPVAVYRYSFSLR